MKNIYVLLIVRSFFSIGMSQGSVESPDVQNDPLTFSGYLEPYYSYDFGNPDSHVRQPFVYSYNRHNEVNLNLGIAKMAYNQNKVRANLALMAGTYANDNLSAEPGVMRNIFEANVGVNISKTKNLWIDAGILGSHIGFETAIGKDCWNLTRSILADNSPYYESGVRLSYMTDNGKWYLSALVVNGWQRIYRVIGNNTPAFGHQITFKPNSNITLNSSSFIGNDKPDDLKQMRIFHNFFGVFQLSQSIAATLGFDIGTEEQTNGNNSSVWYSPVVIFKVSLSDKINLAIRGEYYNDENGVIIATGTPNGFQTFGYSMNVDYLIAENVMWRTEFRGFSSQDEIFMLDNRPSTQNYFITSAFAIAF